MFSQVKIGLHLKVFNKARWNLKCVGGPAALDTVHWGGECNLSKVSLALKALNSVMHDWLIVMSWTRVELDLSATIQTPCIVSGNSHTRECDTNISITSRGRLPTVPK